MTFRMLSHLLFICHLFICHWNAVPYIIILHFESVRQSIGRADRL